MCEIYGIHPRDCEQNQILKADFHNLNLVFHNKILVSGFCDRFHSNQHVRIMFPPNFGALGMSKKITPFFLPKCPLGHAGSWGASNTRIVDSELNYIRNLLSVFLLCKLNMRSFGSVMCYEQLMLPLEHQGVSLMLVCCVGKARWCIWQSCQLKIEGKPSLKFLYFSVHYEQNFKNLYDL